MAFFRKKEAQVLEKEEPIKPAAHKRPQSLQELAHERVLTAEGWRRRSLLKALPAKSKK